SPSVAYVQLPKHPSGGACQLLYQVPDDDRRLMLFAPFDESLSPYRSYPLAESLPTRFYALPACNRELALLRVTTGSKLLRPPLAIAPVPGKSGRTGLRLPPRLPRLRSEASAESVPRPRPQRLQRAACLAHAATR